MPSGLASDAMAYWAMGCVVTDLPSGKLIGVTVCTSAPSIVKVETSGVWLRGPGAFEIRPRGSGSTFTWSERIDLPLGALGRLGWPVAEPLIRAGYRASLRRFAEFARTYRLE